MWRRGHVKERSCGGEVMRWRGHVVEMARGGDVM